MRHVCECCCGAQATFDTSGSNDAFVRGSVNEAYKRWMQQHDGCPALYAKPQAPQTVYATGPFADCGIELPAEGVER